jgi:putative NADH-flavin reductase
MKILILGISGRTGRLVAEEAVRRGNIVRPVGLNDKNDDLSIISDINDKGKVKSMISRNAVAHFILCSIENVQFIGKKPVISNK